MNYAKIAIGVLLALSVSRLIPHPPNFTSLIALSFYIPAIFGIKFIPVVVLSFFLTDIIIGLHSTLLFTWGSVILIGFLGNKFKINFSFRVTGSLLGALVFFIVTNFGVWLTGSYGYTLSGLVNCYILAIPFFGYSLISTLIFSVAIETLIYFYTLRTKNYLN